MPRPLLLVFVLAALLFLTGVYIYTHSHQSKEVAKNILTDQNIEISQDSFIKETAAGHEENVRAFITLGLDASTQDTNGTTGLMAAIQSDNEAVITRIAATLPSTPQGAQPIITMQDANGKTALMVAAEKGNAKVTEKLIALGTDVTTTDKAQETPLLLAVKFKQEKLLQPLIDADRKQHSNAATLTAMDSKGDAPLIYAIREQSPEMVKTLVSAHVDVNTFDARGTTPLMVAASTGNRPITDLLIGAGARLDVADRFGNTPLTLAIAAGQNEYAKYLIEQGASADFGEHNSTLPMQAVLASEHFDPTLFAFLFSHSKDQSAVPSDLMFHIMDHKDANLAKLALARSYDAKAMNDKGETLLYHAIEGGLEDAAIELIDKGADMNITGIPGLSPLGRAVEHNEPRVVSKLLSLGVSPNQKVPGGYTLAEMAVYSGYPEVLEALIGKGAEVQPDFGIVWSIRDGGGKCVPVLLDHGGHADVMNNTGNSALWLAAATGETGAAKALIAHHATIDLPNKEQGMTPLAAATHNGQIATATLLVEAGAKLEATDNYGMTPLAHAAYMSKPIVVEYLIGKGANTKASDKQGRSVIDLAGFATSSADRDKVLSLLMKH